ncbi:MAG: hypothetical protein IMY84_06135 [Chloroflexi bacterium]|nr:hypothetical protein [Chloroflexota bacterium]
MWRTVGQESSTEMLSRSIGEGSIHHAYLFVGPEHVGKRTLAIDLACALNCESEQRPCGECRACLRIIDGKHAGIHVETLEDPAGPEDTDTDAEEGRRGRTIRLHQIHRLQHTSSLPPFEGKTKVLLIENADCMTSEAANCLLKTLEEPPPNVVWMLLAENENRLLETIVSRCQRIGVRPMPAPELQTYLVETRGADPEQAALVARVSQGRTGWAISALTDESVLADRSACIESIIQLIYMGYSPRFELARELDAQYRRDPRSVMQTLQVWTTWWRDLLVVKGGCAESVVNVDYVNDLNEQAASLSLQQIRESIGKLNEARENLDLNVIARLVFDSLVYTIPRIAKAAGDGVPSGALQDKNVTQ